MGFLVMVSAFAGHEFHLKEVLILYVVLIMFSVLVFVKCFGLPFQLWPKFLVKREPHGHSIFKQSFNGFRCLISTLECGVLLYGRLARNSNRRLARHRTYSDHSDVAANHLQPLTDHSVIMIAGIYYGAQYGGSTTSILVNIPGESSSVVTCLDGYQMARRGRAGQALATAGIASFLRGAYRLYRIVFAPPLAEVALKFGPHEYFS